MTDFERYTAASQENALLRKSHEAALAEIARLTEALGWFLDDERFSVAVGGNPIAVEQMLNEARMRYCRAALNGETG